MGMKKDGMHREDVRIWVQQKKAPVCCYTCDNYLMSEGNICGIYKQEPPDSTKEEGCDEWYELQIPF